MEKLPFAGGRCATHDYHGYKLNTGLNTVTDECHGALCREVGAEFEMRVTDNQWVYRIHGKDYPQPKSGKGVLKTMIGHAARNEAEADRLMQAIKRCMAWAPPTYSMSLDEWLREYTDNPAILGMFQNYLAAAGAIRNSELPAGEYFRMMKEIDASGRIWGYLPGGGGQLSDSLVKAIKRMGGEVWTGSPAVQIKVKDGVAIGAVVRKGGESIEISGPGSHQRCRSQADRGSGGQGPLSIRVLEGRGRREGSAADHHLLHPRQAAYRGRLGDLSDRSAAGIHVQHQHQRLPGEGPQGEASLGGGGLPRVLAAAFRPEERGGDRLFRT